MVNSNNQPSIYIIVPVFNAANYIESAAESVIGQDYNNWHCVMINDCSSDNSEEVCLNFCKNDSRFIYIKNEINSGPAHTRNIGIDAAIEKGADYLAFLDSDDLLEPNYLSTLLKTAEENKADIVWCNYYEYKLGYENKKVYKSHGFTSHTFISEKQLVSCFFEDRAGLGCLWNKLYSVEFITRNNLRINEERVRAEDWEFNLRAFQCEPKLVPINDALYNYIHYPRPSVMATYRELDYELYWRSRELQLQAAQKYDVEYDRNLFDGTLMYNIINNLKLLKKSNYPSADERMNYILNDPRFITLLKSSTHKSQCLAITFRLVYLAMKLRQIWLVKILL